MTTWTWPPVYSNEPPPANYHTLLLQLAEAQFAAQELVRCVGAAYLAIEDGYSSENEMKLDDAVADYRKNKAQIAGLRARIDAIGGKR